MARGAQAEEELTGRAEGASHLEDMLRIAVVIAAGCESCAEKMVRAALARGGSGPQIERTLAAVAHLRSLDCFVQAVGAEVVERMAKPLQAGVATLRAAQLAAEERSCSC